MGCILSNLKGHASTGGGRGKEHFLRHNASTCSWGPVDEGMSDLINAREEGKSSVRKVPLRLRGPHRLSF